MSYDKAARTAFANRAFVLSEMFNAKFRNARFSGAVNRVVKVIPPETESTGGGKMARDSITLVPESEGAGGSSIVIGWLDVGHSVAELRSYAVLAERHKDRFGSLAFDLEKAEYETFLTDAQTFLAAEAITTTLITDANNAGGTPPPSRPDKSGGMQVLSANASGRGLDQEKSSGGAGMGLLIAAAVIIGMVIGVAGVLLIVK